MVGFFNRGSPMAELERQMMMIPNFAPRGYGSVVLCRYRPTAADVDCRNCLQYRRRSCRSLTCPYLSERLEAGVATLEELALETVRPSTGIWTLSSWAGIPWRRTASGGRSSGWCAV